MTETVINWFSILQDLPSFIYPAILTPHFPLPEDWYEQLYPLILTLKDCMGEVVSRAKQSLTFVLLQELAYSLPQCLMLTLRRDVVFSQAVGALVVASIALLGCALLALVRVDVFLEQFYC